MRRWLLLIVGLALLVEYLPAFHGGFLYEDHRWLVGCERSADSWRLAHAWTQASWCAQLGQPFWAWHGVNLLLHGLVMALLVVLLRLMGVSSLVAVVAAGLSALHPLNQEAVAYLSGRGELLAALGVLGALWAAYHERWVIALACLAIGIAGKETAVIALALAPLVWARRARWVIASLLLLMGAVLWSQWGAALWWPSSLVRIRPWVLQQSTAAMRLLILQVLPLNPGIDADYHRVPILIQILSLGSGLGLAIWSWWQRARLPWMALGVLWMLVGVSLRLVLWTPGSPLNAHQLYTPGLGRAFVLAGLFSREWRHP